MSAIDPTQPVALTPTTASVRANFAAAATEIDDLLTRVAALEAYATPAVQPTWNPADAGTAMLFTNGNRTANETRGNYTAVRSTSPKSAGRWYAEIQYTGTWSTGNTAGIATAAAAAGTGLNFEIGAFPQSYGLRTTSSTTGASSNRANGSGSTASGTISIPANTIVGFALDCDARQLLVFRNQEQVQLWTNLEAVPFYLCASPYDFSATVTIPTQQLWVPPGFQAWT
jgi:hypothetical protein